jgi:hypothetical protein
MSFWEKFKLLTNSIWEFIKPTVKWLGSRTGGILMDAAISACQQVAANPNIVKSGNLAMRQAAFDIIVNTAKTQGKQLGVDFLEHQVNTLIELEVSKIKAKEGE